MSQDANSRQSLLNSVETVRSTSTLSDSSNSSARISSDGFSVESYADCLMDELFDEVEQALDMQTRLPRQLVTPSNSLPDALPQSQPQPLPSPPSAVLEMSREDLEPGFPLVLVPNPEVVDSEAPVPEEPDSTAIAALVEEATLAKKIRQPGRTFDRLLLIVGGLSVIVTLGLWLLSQRSPQRVVTTTAASTQLAPSAALPKTDQQFSEYVQRALQTIDQKAPSGTPTGATAPATGASSPLPTVAVPATPAGVPSLPATRPSTTIERIYVPLKKLPANLFPDPSKTASAPTASPVAPMPANPGTIAVNPSTLAAPVVSRTIVGVLELGDRSAALIEMGGVVQRFRVGESIGTTGWTLAEVSKNQAIIRRNGEVRSVFIGQSF